MLYFKTSKGRLVIDLFVGENEIEPGKDEHIYMLIEPDERKIFYTSERVWNRFLKKSDPKPLNQNEEDYALYQSVSDAEDEDQQYWADIEWQMEQAVHMMGFKQSPKNE